ncbi:MAG: NifU family protein [Candidatus Carbobacillus sp.]|nr:NifU family protein [Candidatus Carbobacillus sp.]
MYLERRVRRVIEQMRPTIQRDGGDIELVDITGQTVRIRFHGTCMICPSSEVTLKAGIEQAIVSMVPEIKEVIRVP